MLIKVSLGSAKKEDELKDWWSVVVCTLPVSPISYSRNHLKSPNVLTCQRPVKGQCT